MDPPLSPSESTSIMDGDGFSTQTKVSFLGVVTLWGHYKFIPSDWAGDE